MAKEPNKKINDIDVAMAIIGHEAVSCFCGKEQQPSEQPKQPTSCTGGNFCGKDGEQWPVSADGQPLIPWLQIVCAEMKGLYGVFYNRKAVCFYIHETFRDGEATSTSDGSDFVVREYGLDEKLVPLSRPSSLVGHPFHRISWVKKEDYPSVSKYHGLFNEAVYTSLCQMENFQFKNQSGIKIGGWPTPVQRKQEYPGSWDLQIDMTENFQYGDSGIGYLSRRGGRWYVLFECC